jgi:hypothetical protein
LRDTAFAPKQDRERSEMEYGNRREPRQSMTRKQVGRGQSASKFIQNGRHGVGMARDA